MWTNYITLVIALFGTHFMTSTSLRLRSSDTKSNSVLDDVTYCAFEWLDQLPRNLVEQNTEVLNQLGGNLPENLQFLPLLEPYLTYLVGISDPENDGFIDVFANYCSYRHGVMSLMACTQTQPWMTSVHMASVDVGNLALQLYTRYCDLGRVKKSVLLSLLRGKKSKAIGQMSEDILHSIKSGTKMVCSDVVDGFLQTMVKFIGNDESMDNVLDAIRSGAEDFSKCMVAAFSQDHSLKVLTEHADMVLLHLVGLNMAAISKAEVKSGRISIAMVGYGHIIVGDRQAETCAIGGAHVLLENENIAVTGTMLYDRHGGSLLPYLAAVHVKVILYREGDWKPVGQVTYSTSLGNGQLDNLLTSFWWEEEMEGRVTDRDHNVSIQSVGRMIDIFDLNSQINIILSKQSNMLNVVIRMDHSALFQSKGLLIEDCPYAKHTTHYGLVQPVPECQNGCMWVNLQVANTLCKKDCDMKKNGTQQVYDTYLNYEEMLVIAATKDDLFVPELMASTETPEEIRLPYYKQTDFATIHSSQIPPFSTDMINTYDRTYKVRHSSPTTESYATEPIRVRPTTRHHKTPRTKVLKIFNSQADALSVAKPENKGVAIHTTTNINVLVSIFAILLIIF